MTAIVECNRCRKQDRVAQAGDIPHRWASTTFVNYGLAELLTVELCDECTEQFRAWVHAGN